MDKGKPAPALWIFLLFFLLTPVLPTCKKFSADECKAAHPVPGHDLVGLGFDITSMESTRGMLVDTHQLQDKDGTCTLCVNTLLEGNPLEILPLAVTEWNITAECKREVSAVMLPSIMYLAMKTGEAVLGNWYTGLDVRVPNYTSGHEQNIVIGSHSKIIKFSQEQSVWDKYIFFHHEIKCKKYSFRIRENPPTSEEFKESVKSLPEQYDSSTAPLYHRLIRNFGTHYLSGADLGGLVRSVTAVKLCEMMLSEFTAWEVKQCLTAQISSTTGAANINATGDFAVCQQAKLNSQYLRMTAECRTITQGGKQAVEVCHNEVYAEDYNMWLASLSTVPGLIAYEAHPIHTLVSEQDPQREGLKKAVSAYIKARALVIRCTNTCPLGHKPIADIDCACQCPYDGLTDDICCARKYGISKLTVWIDRAYNLRGDWFSEADAAVDVEFHGIVKGTDYVWNNNNPVFDRQFDFGVVELVPGITRIKITIKEWNPRPWGVVHLSVCWMRLGAGPVQNKICYLKHGHLLYRYQAVCGPYLSGPNCRDYVSQKPTYSSVLGQDLVD